MASGQLITGGSLSTEENKNEGSITNKHQTITQATENIASSKEVQDRFYIQLRLFYLSTSR